MKKFNKCFFIGLPRSGGQSAQRAMQLLYPNQAVWHSPGNNWAHMDNQGPWIAAVEVFAPVEWLMREYPASLYIYNDRDKTSWLKSCKSVYDKSRSWNHPIWKYPLSQFLEYRRDYCDSYETIYEDVCILNLIKSPRWDELCKFLELPIPDVSFPNIDRVKRSITKSYPKPFSLASKQNHWGSDF